MKEFLQRSESPKENAAVSLMEQVLSKNNFVFNGQNYIQVKGTAMGTRAAPNYANLFMGLFEERHIYKSIWKKHIRYFGRYIDDLFIIWTGSEASLLEFINHLNNVHDLIKFTHKYSKEEIEFLDVLIKKCSKGYLSTDVFQKDTDTHSYLHSTSAHPIHCKKSIPYSRFKRLRRICSEKDTLKKRIKEFIEYFVNSGYSRRALLKTAKRVLTEDEAVDNIQKENRYRLIITHNDKLPSMKDLVLKHWPITQTNQNCRKYLNYLKSHIEEIKT